MTIGHTILYVRVGVYTVATTAHDAIQHRPHRCITVALITAPAFESIVGRVDDLHARVCQYSVVDSEERPPRRVSPALLVRR